MAAERHALESSVIEMNTRGAQIDRWLRDNESKTPTGERRSADSTYASGVPDVGLTPTDSNSLVMLLTSAVP